MTRPRRCVALRHARRAAAVLALWLAVPAAWAMIEDGGVEASRRELLRCQGLALETREGALRNSQRAA